jgi:hypothetical protein
LFSNKKYKEIDYLQKLEEKEKEKKSNQRKRGFFHVLQREERIIVLKT